MGTIRRFEEIQAWQKARELVREIYGVCSVGALSRDYGLKDQLRRASVSVMSNIAEGFSRGSAKEFARFLDISKASASEVQSLLYVALDVGYINQSQFTSLYQKTDEAIALIVKFSKYLRGRG